MHCPSCGQLFTDVYEARRVVPTVVAKGGTRNRVGWERVDQMPAPRGEGVVQPCGCVLSLPLARALTGR